MNIIIKGEDMIVTYKQEDGILTPVRIVYMTDAEYIEWEAGKTAKTSPNDKVSTIISRGRTEEFVAAYTANNQNLRKTAQALGVKKTTAATYASLAKKMGLL